MDKKTASITLTEKLREHNAPEIIVNSHYQKKLVKEALACYQVGEMIAVASYSLRENLKQKYNLCEKIEPKANYFFLENFEVDKRLIASSFAIIGEEEINQLRNTFYKDVPHEVETALKALDIKNYIGLYEKYACGELEKDLSGVYSLYLKFKNSLCDLFPAKNSYCGINIFEDYLGMGRKEINRVLSEKNMYKAYSWSDDIVHGSTITDIISKLESIINFDLLPDFFNMVFTIPHEEQNIETNKTILRLPCETLDYTKILVNEYFNGKNFQGYFDCLDVEKQKKVISVLEFKKADNAVYNSFLWSKGFKTIGLDHLRLYKNDSKGFMEYFGSKPVEEKKAIIKDLMECDVTNEEVVNWLTKNHMDLVREVGLQ